MSSACRLIPALLVGVLLTSTLHAPSAAAAPSQAGAPGTPAWFTDCAATMTRTEAERVALPRTSAQLLELIGICNSTVQRLISEGQFASVFLPAMMGKDVALAL